MVLQWVFSLIQVTIVTLNLVSVSSARPQSLSMDTSGRKHDTNFVMLNRAKDKGSPQSLTELFEILGNALILFLAQGWMRGSIPLSTQYEAGAGRV